jgi:hypothetical protein
MNNNTLQKIENYIKTITPGQRIEHHIEKLISNDDWESIEEIQMLVRGNIPKDIFVTLRFEQNDFVVDFYRLPNK